MDRASRSLIIQVVLIIFQNSRRLPGVLANHRLPVLLLDLRVSGETKTSPFIGARGTQVPGGAKLDLILN